MVKRILLVLLFLMCVWSGNVCAKSDISYEIDQLKYTDWVGVIIIAKMGCDVYLDTSPFDVNLSSADTNAQKAFETLDELVKVSTATYSFTASTATYAITSGTATYSQTSSTSTYAESVNYDILVSSANYAPGDNLGNHTATQDIDASGYKVTSSSLAVTNNATVGSLSSSGQVTSNGNKLIDIYDWAVVITTPTWLGTDAVLISPIRSFAVTITTITMITTGGNNFIGMVEQRPYASPHSAGTDVWTGDVTVSSTTWATGTVSDYTVPANYGLYLVPTSVSGPVKILTLRGIVSKD